jgi:hypothetical protein
MDLKLTFASSLHDETKKNIDPSHVETLEEKVQTSMALVNDVHFNQQMITRKMKSHYETAQLHNYRIKLMTFIEALCMIVILFGQAFYIKRLIDKM